MGEIEGQDRQLLPLGKSHHRAIHKATGTPAHVSLPRGHQPPGQRWSGQPVVAPRIVMWPKLPGQAVAGFGFGSGLDVYSDCR